MDLTKASGALKGEGCRTQPGWRPSPRRTPSSCVSYPQDFPGVGAALSTVQKTETPK